MSTNDWRDQVYYKLEQTIGRDVETVIRVKSYLDQELVEYEDSDVIPPALLTLKLSLESHKMFVTYAIQLAEDTKHLSEDPDYRDTMDEVWSGLMEASEESFDDRSHQGFDLERLADRHIWTNSSSGLRAAILKLSQKEITSLIPKLLRNRSIGDAIDEMVAVLIKSLGPSAIVGLVALTFVYDLVNNVKRWWWHGHISRKRCAKNVIDTGMCFGAGVAGGLLGALVGSLSRLFGSTVGTLIGGIAGGKVVGQSANILVDRLTQMVFNIPRDESLENAYKYLGVTASASNHEINERYRRLCLRLHPNRRRKREDFLLLQKNMFLIKEARRGQI